MAARPAVDVAYDSTAYTVDVILPSVPVFDEARATAAGFIKGTDVADIVTSDGFIKTADVAPAATSAGFIKASDVDAAANTAGYLKTANLDTAATSDGFIKSSGVAPAAASAGFLRATDAPTVTGGPWNFTGGLKVNGTDVGTGGGGGGAWTLLHSGNAVSSAPLAWTDLAGHKRIHIELSGLTDCPAGLKGLTAQATVNNGTFNAVGAGNFIDSTNGSVTNNIQGSGIPFVLASSNDSNTWGWMTLDLYQIDPTLLMFGYEIHSFAGGLNPNFYYNKIDHEGIVGIYSALSKVQIPFAGYAFTGSYAVWAID